MTPVVLLVSLAALGYTACYLVMCSQFPFGRCRRHRCENGRVYSRLSRKMFRDCPRCDGTGKRIRIGRRVYEKIRDEFKAGNP